MTQKMLEILAAAGLLVYWSDIAGWIDCFLSPTLIWTGSEGGP